MQIPAKRKKYNGHPRNRWETKAKIKYFICPEAVVVIINIIIYHIHTGYLKLPYKVFKITYRKIPCFYGI